MESYKNLEKKVKKEYGTSFAIIPVGCMEQHGPFLPLETDILIADYYSSELSIKLDKIGILGYKYPYIGYSPTRSNTDYIGTVSISENNFRKYTKDICKQIINGVHDAVIFVSGHGPADPSLREIAFAAVNKQFKKNKKVKPVFVLSIMDLTGGLENTYNQRNGKHADWREFSLILKILGDEYFGEDIIGEMRKFDSNNIFNYDSIGVLGIPVQYRSIEGVIGDQLPRNIDDYHKIADEIWKTSLERGFGYLTESWKKFCEQHGEIK